MKFWSQDKNVKLCSPPAGGMGRRPAECAPLPNERTHRIFLQEPFSINFLSIFIFFIYLIFSLQEVERWRKKQWRRGQKAFQDSLIFLTLRILKNFSLRIYFLGLAFKKTKLILKSLKKPRLYCCSSYIAVIYSTLKQSPEQTKRAADNWATGKHLNQQPDNLLRTNLYWH